MKLFKFTLPLSALLLYLAPLFLLTFAHHWDDELASRTDDLLYDRSILETFEVRDLLKEIIVREILEARAPQPSGNPGNAVYIYTLRSPDSRCTHVWTTTLTKSEADVKGYSPGAINVAPTMCQACLQNPYFHGDPQPTRTSNRGGNLSAPPKGNHGGPKPKPQPLKGGHAKKALKGRK
ncbi:hypothetical protein CC1G_09162 [Coprinopsis cinerea okayama7|uniref:Uncharacterized protein n=1 Tax=Coprinopsis cinerea (strain Okayama-7 / 130 / ATCC MYA-4618 / FGSC 9003) TaxID=240176 RepID=A8P9S6_COPC7|nr:hypothetical protein CC1G_09162 [Coprinopsis cinerea okayama7\|eukprot:XP_001839828.1 hypothetical protein CC1G_09162 [Coprinopsis cinerea okayama7\